MNASPAPGDRAVDRLVAVYAVASAFALLGPSRPGVWPLLLLAHVLAAAVLSGVLPLRPPRERAIETVPRALGLLRDWYPLLIIPALYAELAVLNVSVWGGQYFDATVIGWERAVFGGEPAREWAVAMPWRWLSEPLHAAYISYYAIIYGPPVLLFAAGRRDAFRATVFALMLTFFVHYLFFIYFPVQGPRYLFPPPVGEVAQGPVYALAHQLLEAGSSRGAAFPSSHVGVAVAQTMMIARFAPRWAPLVGGLTIGLALGAVYGGFHYAIDAAAGLLLGAALALLAPSLRRRFDPGSR